MVQVQNFSIATLRISCDTCQICAMGAGKVREFKSN